MRKLSIDRSPWYVAALAACLAVAHLAWQYSHGGVPSHHFLDRADMPTVSNGWGLAVLPVLGWLAAWSALRRFAVEPDAVRKACAAALGALLVGAALSVAFVTGHEQVTSWIFFAALLCGLALPTYRAEYVFGFVIGMVFVFGAVLPTLAAAVGAGISAAFHRLVWPAFAWAVRRYRPSL